MLKAKIPENSLGSYLTQIDWGSSEIERITGIPVSDIRKMRSFDIEAIPAYRLFLISLALSLPISEVLKNVYPLLKLSNTTKPVSRKIKESTSQIGKIIFNLEEFNLDILAHKTGLKRDRLQRLTNLDRDKIDAHELFLIEMASDSELGSLFTELYGDLKLSQAQEKERMLIKKKVNKTN